MLVLTITAVTLIARSDGLAMVNVALGQNISAAASAVPKIVIRGFRHSGKVAGESRGFTDEQDKEMEEWEKKVKEKNKKNDEEWDKKTKQWDKEAGLKDSADWDFNKCLDGLEGGHSSDRRPFEYFDT